MVGPGVPYNNIVRLDAKDCGAEYEGKDLKYPHQSNGARNKAARDRGKTVPKGRPRKERDVALVSAHDERLEKSAIGTGYNPEEQRQEEVSNPETGSPEGPDHITAGAVARRHDSEEDDPSQDSGTERNDDDSGTEPDPRPPDDGRKHNDESDAGKHKSLAVVVDAPKLARQVDSEIINWLCRDTRVEASQSATNTKQKLIEVYRLHYQL
ncbi:Protein of unknown function [Pyronema omphalodes CBS 100304]|uniref:Uncharacterized protein n=1 Tax=Pyronema omphalodes (strain CBS 100304) TaxID=1076935 RepID=U4LJ42_PYROM|nr:Protein of unknown function [Pyronema omphalodes CBS 100304]